MQVHSFKQQAIWLDQFWFDVINNPKDKISCLLQMCGLKIR